MSRKKKYKSISPFHDRLYSLLGNDVAGWSKKLGVSHSLLPKWFEGSFPSADKIISICKHTGASPEYILLDIERTGEDFISTLPERTKAACRVIGQIFHSQNEEIIHIIEETLDLYQKHTPLVQGINSTPHKHQDRSRKTSYKKS
jgi:hypothetical protein